MVLGSGEPGRISHGVRAGRTVWREAGRVWLSARY